MYFRHLQMKMKLNTLFALLTTFLLKTLIKHLLLSLVSFTGFEILSTQLSLDTGDEISPGVQAWSVFDKKCHRFHCSVLLEFVSKLLFERVLLR